MRGELRSKRRCPGVEILLGCKGLLKNKGQVVAKVTNVFIVVCKTTHYL